MSAKGGEARNSRDDLVQALESGQLSEALAKQGRDILARIDKPLRLSVMGLPKSGKSTLMNLLLGANVFPKDLALPTISLTHGEEPVAKCTLPNGAVQTFASDDLASLAAMNPAYIELSLPLAALGKLSMMEVVASDNMMEQKRAVSWAAKRTDIALWCTQSSTDREEQLWQLLPDYVQDHSFLVLTKADALGAEGRLAGLVETANDIGGDYFRQVLPVATKVALSARKTNGTVDKAVLRNSGGVALITAILREVETGQRAAADAADIFLRQIDFDPAGPAPVTPEPVAETAPEPEPELAEAAPEEPVAAEPAPVIAEPIAEIPDEAEPEPAPEPEPVVAEAEVKPPEAPAAKAPKADADEDIAPMTPEAKALCRQAVDQLVAEGEALSHQFELEQLTPESVIEVSVDTVTWLADYLADNEVAQEPAMKNTRMAASDAADLALLIQLEKGDNVALDALSLMIQLKHEIQSELAA